VARSSKSVLRRGEALAKVSSQQAASQLVLFASGGVLLTAVIYQGGYSVHRGRHTARLVLKEVSFT
jgi:hypothetical protein